MQSEFRLIWAKHRVGRWLSGGVFIVLGVCCAPPPPPPIHVTYQEPATGPASIYSFRRHWTIDPPSGSRRWRVHERVYQTRKIRSIRRLGSLDEILHDQILSPLRKVQAFVNSRPIEAKHIRHLRPVGRSSFLTDHRVYRLHYPGVRSGQSTSYRYQRTHTDMGFLPRIRVPNLELVKTFDIQVDHPPQMQATFRLAPGLVYPQPTVSRSGGRTRLLFQNLRRNDHLPYFPFNHRHTEVQVVLRSGDHGIQPLTMERRAAWSRDLMGLRPSLTPANIKFARKLLKGARTQKQQMQRLYDFTRKKIRYIADSRGLGGFVPRPAHVVLKRRWGDCKDKARLLVELARLISIRAYLVLVSVKGERSFSDLWPFIYDHAIVAYEHNGQLKFLDAVGSTTEFGNLPEMDIDRSALLLRRRPMSFRIPAPNRLPAATVDVTATVGALSRGRARITVRNALLHRLRLWQSTMATTALGHRLRTHLRGRLGGLGLSRFNVLAVHQDRAVLTADADLSRLLVQTATSLYAPKAPLGLFGTNLHTRIRDRLPVQLPHRVNVRLRLHIAAPGYVLHKQSDITGRTPGTAFFRSRFGASGGQITADYQFSQNRRYLVGQTKRSFIHLHRKYRSYGNQNVRFSKPNLSESAP